MSLHGTTGPCWRTKVHDIRGMSFDWPNPHLRLAQTKSVGDKRCGKILLPKKVGHSLP